MESGEERVALLHGEGEEDLVLERRCLIESKKLWWIVGPAVFSRVVTYSMNVITLAFAGHLGDLELASITIANTVVVGFSFGLMVSITINFLSLRVFVVSTPPVLTHCHLDLLLVVAIVGYDGKPIKNAAWHGERAGDVMWAGFRREEVRYVRRPPVLAAQAGEVSMLFIPLHFSFAFAFAFPLQRFLQCQLKNSINAKVCAVALLVHLFVTRLFVSTLQLGLIGTTLTLNFSSW
ncbi:hypothetical protein GW17_00049523, partial [Ensete ventricosum]